MKGKNLLGTRQNTVLALFAVLLSLVLAACSSGSTATDFTLTGVDWQWQSWSTSEGIDEVPTPADYTINFNTDGTLSGKADCNNFAGSYTQDNGGIQITLGPSTLVACPEGSLGSTYTQLLSQVVAGGPDGSGDLALENAGGETRMIFSNPNAAAAGSTSDIMGIPWWAWLLGLALLGLLLWLLMRGNKANAKPTATEAARAQKAAPPVAKPVAAATVAAPVAAAPKPVVKPDDLTKIEGIGPKIAGVLTAAGITTFAALAKSTQAELTSILNASDIHGSYGDPTTWPAQAELAAAGEWESLESMQESLKGGRIE